MPEAHTLVHSDMETEIHEKEAAGTETPNMEVIQASQQHLLAALEAIGETGWPPRRISHSTPHAQGRGGGRSSQLLAGSVEGRRDRGGRRRAASVKGGSYLAVSGRQICRVAAFWQAPILSHTGLGGACPKTGTRFPESPVHNDCRGRCWQGGNGRRRNARSILAWCRRYFALLLALFSAPLLSRQGDRCRP